MQTLLFTLLLVSLAAFLLLRSAETRLLYPRPLAETTFGHEPATLIRIRSEGATADIPALFQPARAERPTIVTFHGNGEQLSDFASWVRALRDAGLGAMVVEYPGYGLSAAGDPSEQAIYKDADLALYHLREVLGVGNDKIILLGESLGTGVAVEMAARGYGSGLILVSPYSSIPEMAEVLLPWFPASSLLRDRYDSGSKAPHVRIPALVLHGTDDGLIPAEMAKELSRRFRRSNFVALQGIGHGGIVNVYSQDILAHIEPWLESVGPRQQD